MRQHASATSDVKVEGLQNQLVNEVMLTAEWEVVKAWAFEQNSYKTPGVEVCGKVGSKQSEEEALPCGLQCVSKSFFKGKISFSCCLHYPSPHQLPSCCC